MRVIPARQTSGFTLMELLITVGLVAILAALTMPALSGMRQGGRETRSLQQLRQIAAAMHVYATDDLQRFPPGYFYNPEARPRERTWASELLRYMGLPANFYHVEGNPFVAPTSVVPVRSGVAASFTPFTYSVNGGLCPDISAADTRPRLAEVVRPGEVILVGDGAQLTNTYAASTLTKPAEFGRTASSQTVNLDTPIPVGPDLDDPNARGYLRYRNRGRVACVMVDGNARLFPKGSILYRHVVFSR